MKGSTYRRCGCRGDDGKLLSACPEIDRKRNHGTWYYRVDVGVAGRRREQRRGGFPTKTAAEAALAKVVVAVGSGEHRHDDRQTVGQYLVAWIDRQESTEAIRPATVALYRFYIVNDLVPALGTLRLGELRHTHVQAMLTRLTAAGRGATTVRRVHATLRSALTSARKGRLVTSNVATDVDLPRVRPAEVQPWSGDELGAFLDAVGTHRLSALFEVLAFTGLRRGEACGLRWRDVDLDNGVLTIRTQLVEVNGTVVEGKPKTRSGQRTAEIGPDTAAALRAHRARQAVERLAIGAAYTATDRVFVREDGVDLFPSYVTKLFGKLIVSSAKDGGPILRPVRLHDLRHGAASLMLASGVPLVVVSKRLGHSSVAITADVYSHLLPGVGRAAAEATEAAVPRRRALI